MEEYLQFEQLTTIQKAEYIHSMDHLSNAINHWRHIQELEQTMARSIEELQQAIEEHMDIVEECEDREFKIQFCSGNIIDLGELHYERRQYAQARINSMRRIDEKKILIEDKQCAIQEATATMNKWIMASLHCYEVEGIEAYVQIDTVEEHYILLENGYEWDFFKDRYDVSTEVTDAEGEEIADLMVCV